MKPRDVAYCFSPTLLDSFQGLLGYEETWEKFWGSSEDPSKSLDEYREECNQSLIDSINHVPFVSEACSKGTAWNDLIDTLVHNKRCGRTFINRVCNDEGRIFAARCQVDGFTFDFDINDAINAAKYFVGSLSQIYVHSYIDTRYGIVNLFGFLDELRRDVVYDIKTSKSYTFGDYSEKWQKHLYPYCLVESGECTNIKEFEYAVFKLSGGNTKSPIITAEQFREVYTYDHELSRSLLREHCERFIEYIEDNRDKITNQNIFKEHERRF